MTPSILERVLDVLAAICFLGAALLALVAAVGMLRFPDLLTRMHAATKPQVVGVGLALLGLALTLRQPWAAVLLVFVAAFQALTAPIASHMIGRASFRARQVRGDLLVTDELSEAMHGDEPRGAP